MVWEHKPGCLVGTTVCLMVDTCMLVLDVGADIRSLIYTHRAGCSHGDEGAVSAFARQIEDVLGPDGPPPAA
jgi:hypothetical protein